jgi:hypothetical protein
VPLPAGEVTHGGVNNLDHRSDDAA